MNDLSAFDGDTERERQICDLHINGGGGLLDARRHCP
jgi:hypothetical protein